MPPKSQALCHQRALRCCQRAVERSFLRSDRFSLISLFFTKRRLIPGIKDPEPSFFFQVGLLNSDFIRLWAAATTPTWRLQRRSHCCTLQHYFFINVCEWHRYRMFAGGGMDGEREGTTLRQNRVSLMKSPRVQQFEQFWTTTEGRRYSDAAY